MNSASFPRVILKHVTTPYQEREDQLQQLSARSWEHLVRGEFGIGEQVAREFLELAKDASDDWHLLAQLRLGTILDNAGRYQEALSHAQAAQNIHSPADRGWCHATGLLGNILLNQGDFDLARTRFLNVLDAWPDCSFALCSLAAVEWNLENCDACHRYALQALESARKADDREHMSVAHNLLGDAELELGDHAQAEKHFRNALAISEEMGRRRGISIACQRLAKVESDRKNYAASLEFGQRAVSAEIEMGRESEITNAYRGALEGLRSTKQPEIILGVISLCNIASEAVTDPVHKIWFLRSEAWLRRDLKQFRQAEKLLSQALSCVEESDEENARIHGMIGVLQKDQKKFTGAKASFLLSAELAEQYGHKTAQQNAYISLGKLARDAGDTSGARDFWQRAQELAQDTGDEKAWDYLQYSLGLLQPSLLGWIGSKLPWRRNR